MKIFYSCVTVENELHFVLFKHTALKRRIQKTGHDEGDSGMLLTFYSLPQRPGNSVLFHPDKHLNMFQCIQKLCTVGRFVNTQVDKMTLSLERNPISSKPQETKTQMFSLYPPLSNRSFQDCKEARKWSWDSVSGWGWGRTFCISNKTIMLHCSHEDFGKYILWSKMKST